MYDPMNGAAPGDRPFVDADSGEASLRGRLGLGTNQDRPRSAPTLPQAGPPPSAASPAAPSVPPTGTSESSPPGAAMESRTGLHPRSELDPWTAQMWQQIASQPGADEYVQRMAQLAQGDTGPKGPEGQDLIDQIRKTNPSYDPNASTSPYAAYGFPAAQAALGNNPFGTALGGALGNGLSLATDVAVKSPVGGAALLADQAGLNTGLRKAVDAEGRPSFESGKIAYDKLMGAFGTVKAQTSSPYLATIAAAPLALGIIGETVGTPGGGGVKGAVDVLKAAKAIKLIPAAIKALPKDDQSTFKYFKALVDSLGHVAANPGKYAENEGDNIHDAIVGLLADMADGEHPPEVYKEAGELLKTLPADMQKSVKTAFDETMAEPPNDIDLLFGKKQDRFVRDALYQMSFGEGMRPDHVNAIRRAAEGEFGNELSTHVADQLKARGRIDVLTKPMTDLLPSTTRDMIARGDFFNRESSSLGDRLTGYHPFKQPTGYGGYDLDHWQRDGGVAWGMKHYGPIAEKLSPKALAGLQIWHSQDYEDLASYLRGGFKNGPQDAKERFIKGIEEAIAQFRSPQNVVFFRGINSDWAEALFKNEAELRAQGHVLSSPGDPSFISVSSNYNRAKSFASFGDGGAHGHLGGVIEYHVPAGTPMAFVDAAIHNAPEEEFLLPRNLAWTFKALTRPWRDVNLAPAHMVVQVKGPK